MATSDPYVSADFSVVATFYDPANNSKVVVMRDIVSISASFALNTIPTATIIAGVGYNPLRPGGGAATIHGSLDKLEQRQRVVVELTITGGAGNTTKIPPPGKYKIFDGFLAGIGIQRSYNQFNYVLNLIHWLDDLNNSSMVAGNWFPGVPDDYTALALQQGVGASGPVQNSGPSVTINKNEFALGNITSDLWEKSIKPVFRGIAAAGGALTLAPNPELINNAALDALNRMPGNSSNYTPLAFLSNNDISGAIATYFVRSIKNTVGQTSFWGKLISDICPQFLFAISPAVDWALPIPFCSGLRWQPGGIEINIDDYSHANCNANMSQIIESVNILYPITTQNGSDRRSPNGPPIIRSYAPAAQYPPQTIIDQNPKRKRGLRLFKQPPIWFEHLADGALAGGLSGGNASTAAAPAPAGGQQGGNQPPTAASQYPVNKTLIENFAKQWFINEVLQHRYGEISGPIRFDIAPGSIVKIGLPPSDPMAVSPGESIVASVIGVSYVINSERAFAGTSFTLAHTKTQDENDSATTDFVGDTPPLYRTGWPGGPLAVREQP